MHRVRTLCTVASLLLYLCTFCTAPVEKVHECFCTDRRAQLGLQSVLVQLPCIHPGSTQWTGLVYSHQFDTSNL